MGDEILFNAVFAVGTANAALLHTGMEALHGLKVLAVDIGLAKLQFTGYAGSGVNVLGEDARCQSVFAVVSPGDGLFDGVVLHQRNDGAESLFMDDVHVLTAVVEHGGSVEVSLLAHTVSAAQQLCALTDSTLHLFRHTFQGTLLYQRTHVDGVVLTDVTDLHSLHLIHQNLRKLSLDLLLDVDALSIVADLAVVADATVNNPLGSLLQISILTDNGRCLAAQLQADLGDVLRSSSHNALAGTDTTRHADNVNLGRASHLVTDDTALTCHDIDDALGQSDLINHLTKDGTVLWCQLRRLDNNGTSGNKRSTGLAGNQEEREVPGQNACHHTDGLLRQEDGFVGTV